MNKFDDVVSRIEDENRDPRETIREGHYFVDDFLNCKLEIIMNGDVLKKIEELLDKTKEYKKEFGCFLYGNRLDDDTIYLSEYSYKDFISHNDYIEVSESNLYELKYLLEKEMFDTVVHVHTHPELGDEYMSCCYAAQDLYAYGHLQLYHQYSEYYTLFIGSMINSYKGNDNISFVYYDEEDKTFYKIPNVYYYEDKNKEYIKSRYCLK